MSSFYSTWFQFMMPNLYSSVLCSYWSEYCISYTFQRILHEWPYRYLKLNRLHTVNYIVVQTQSSSYIFFLNDVPVLSQSQARNLSYPHSFVSCISTHQVKFYPQMENVQGSDLDPGSALQIVLSSLQITPLVAGLRYLWIFDKWLLIKLLLKTLSFGHSVDPDAWLGLVENLLVALLFPLGAERNSSWKWRLSATYKHPAPESSLSHEALLGARKSSFLLPTAPHVWTSKEHRATEPEWPNIE